MAIWAGTPAVVDLPASGKRPAGYANVRAFISVNAGDSIANMPGNYGIPTNVPIVGRGRVPVDQLG